MTVLAVVNAPYTQQFPALDASKIPICVTDPQLAVGAGKVIVPLLLVVPPVPELAVVDPADCVPAKLANDAVTATRA